MQRIPERFFLHVLGTAFGLAYLVAGPSASARAALPDWITYAQASVLLLAGLGGLCAFWGDRRWPVAALFAEWISLRAQAAAVVVLFSATLIVWFVTPTRSTFPYIGVAFFGAWLATDLWRERQVASLTKPLIKRKRRGPQDA